MNARHPGEPGVVRVEDVVLARVGGDVALQPGELCARRADLGVERVGPPAVADVPRVVQAAVDGVGHRVGAEVVDVARGVGVVVLVVAGHRMRPVLERSPGRVVVVRVVRRGAVVVGVVAGGEDRVGIGRADQVRRRRGVPPVARDVPRADDRDRGPGPRERGRPGALRVRGRFAAAARRHEQEGHDEGRHPHGARHAQAGEHRFLPFGPVPRSGETLLTPTPYRSLLRRAVTRGAQAQRATRPAQCAEHTLAVDCSLWAGTTSGLDVAPTMQGDRSVTFCASELAVNHLQSPAMCAISRLSSSPLRCP